MKIEKVKYMNEQEIKKDDLILQHYQVLVFLSKKLVEADKKARFKQLEDVLKFFNKSTTSELCAFYKEWNKTFPKNISLLEIKIDDIQKISKNLDVKEYSICLGSLLLGNIQGQIIHSTECISQNVDSDDCLYGPAILAKKDIELITSTLDTKDLKSIKKELKSLVSNDLSKFEEYAKDLTFSIFDKKINESNKQKDNITH